MPRTAALSRNGFKNLVLTTQPIIYMRLDEVSGTFSHDLSGYNHNGTISNVSYSQAGPLGNEPDGTNDNCFSFNGSSSKIAIPNNTNLNVGDVFSLGFWWQRANDGNVTSTSAFRMVSKQTNAYNVCLFQNKVTLVQTGVAVIAQSTTTYSGDTNWHYTVVTKNGSSVHIYVDKVDVTGAVTNFTMANTTADFQIGVDGSTNWWDGKLDEVTLHNYALSAATVSALYDKGLNQLIGSNLLTTRTASAARTGASVRTSVA